MNEWVLKNRSTWIILIKVVAVGTLLQELLNRNSVQTEWLAIIPQVSIVLFNPQPFTPSTWSALSHSDKGTLITNPPSRSRCFWVELITLLQLQCKHKKWHQIILKVCCFPSTSPSKMWSTHCSIIIGIVILSALLNDNCSIKLSYVKRCYASNLEWVEFHVPLSLVEHLHQWTR